MRKFHFAVSPPRRKSFWIVASAALCILSTALGCSHKEKETEPTVTVQVAPVAVKPIQQIVQAEAVLYPLHQAALVPKVTAPVRKFYVNRGSKVHAGQLLAVLENRDLAAAAVENRGAYEQAEAAYSTTTSASLPEEIQKAELDVKAAKANLDAEQKVHDSRVVLFNQGALPRKELDASTVALTQARNQYDIADKHLSALLAVGKQNEMKSAAGQLTSAKGKYQGAEAQLSYSEIRSPINGVVTDRPLYPGETAAAGTPLMTIMDTSQVIAKTHLPQAEAVLLKPGDPATLKTAGSDEVQGKVTLVSPALDPNSTTVEVWVQAANPKQQLKPGSSVEITARAKSIPDAVVIPSSALLKTPEGATTVMIAGSDGRAHQRDVKVGVREGNEVQIAEGLKAGENVITSGGYGLPDNTKIQVESPNNKPGDKGGE
jgi:RND family efflux transporter MFP subunit